jgi:hypothetical protein
MQAFLWRRRCWLLAAALTLIALCLVAWLQSQSEDAAETAFRQIQPGMTAGEVDAAVHGSRQKHREEQHLEHGPFQVSPKDAPLVASWFGYRITPDRYLVAYFFEFDKVGVVFGPDHRVVDKSLVRYLKPTFLDRLRLGLNRLQAALGL